MNFLGRHREQDVVAFGGDGRRTAFDLRADVSKVVAALRDPPADPVALLVFENDLYLFAAAMLGAAAAGFRIAVPADLQGATIAACLEDGRASCLLHDTNVGGHLRLQTVLQANAGQLIEMPATLCIGVLTARRGRVATEAVELTDLLAALGGIGLVPEPARTLATAPPTHPHVLAAAVILPLVGGGSFARDIAASPGEVFVELQRGAVDNLVSAGAHLRALAASQATVAGAVGRVYSVLGSLESGTPAQFRARHGLDIKELAPRSDAAQRVLDPIFALAHVVDAAVVCVPGGDSFIAVSGQGVRSEDVLGVASNHDVVVVTEIVRDAFGTPDERAILRHFGLAADGSDLAMDLDLGSVKQDGDIVRATVSIPSNYVYFDGHFDTYPILPGVVQLHEIVVPLCAGAKPNLGPVLQLQRLKFLGRIEPGDVVDVELRFDKDDAVCDFEITTGARKCSAGRLCFATTGAPA